MLFLCLEIAETDKSTFPSRRNIRVREGTKAVEKYTEGAEKSRALC